jgi:hypothetical protein
MYEPLRHEGAESKSDETLDKEAAACLEGDKARQFGVTLLETAFAPNFPWLTFDMQRESYPAIERFKSIEQRTDIRQTVVTELTGMLKNMARKRGLDAQAELVDAAISCEDKTVMHFVQAFPAKVVAVYGPLPRIFADYMKHFPWERNDKELIPVKVTLLDALVQDRGELGQVMTHLRMRMLVDERDWQTLIPVEKRMEVAKARNAHELEYPDKPFTARDEMKIVTPRIIAENIPLERLKPIFLEAEKLLGFAPPPSEVKTEPPPEATPSAPPAPVETTENALNGSPDKTSSPPDATSSNTPPNDEVKTTVEEVEDDVSNLFPPQSDVPPVPPDSKQPDSLEEAFADLSDKPDDTKGTENRRQRRAPPPPLPHKSR